MQHLNVVMGLDGSPGQARPVSRSPPRTYWELDKWGGGSCKAPSQVTAFQLQHVQWCVRLLREKKRKSRATKANYSLPHSHLNKEDINKWKGGSIRCYSHFSQSAKTINAERWHVQKASLIFKSVSLLIITLPSECVFEVKWRKRPNIFQFPFLNVKFMSNWCQKCSESKDLIIGVNLSWF